MVVGRSELFLSAAAALAQRGNLSVSGPGAIVGTVEGKSKWHHQVFQDSFLLKR